MCENESCSVLCGEHPRSDNAMSTEEYVCTYDLFIYATSSANELVHVVRMVPGSPGMSFETQRG